MSKRNLTVLGIILLALLALIASGFWYVNNKQSEVDTSDWVTYQNEEYNIEFQYPEDPNTMKIYLNNLVNNDDTRPIEMNHIANIYCTNQDYPDKGAIYIGYNTKNYNVEQIIENYSTTKEIRPGTLALGNFRDHKDKRSIKKIGDKKNVFIYSEKHKYGIESIYIFTIKDVIFSMVFNEPGCNINTMETIIKTVEIK